MALGAMAGIAVLLKKAEENNLPADLRLNDWRRLDDDKIEKILNWLWEGQTCKSVQQLIKCVQSAKEGLETLINR